RHMRAMHHDVIRRPREPRLADRHRAVVRLLEPAEQAAETERHVARDDPELTGAAPRRAAAAFEEIPDAAPDDTPAERERIEHAPRMRAGQRRAEADDASRARQRAVLEELQNQHTAEAMPDEVHAPARQPRRKLREPRRVLVEPASDRRIDELICRVAGRLETSDRK